MVTEGVGIDVIPVELRKTNEVSVERVVLPNNIRKDEPFEARVVLNNDADESVEGDGVVRGTLKLVSRQGGREEVLVEEKLELEPGKKFLTFEDKIQEPDFYEYQAIFTAEDAEQDRITQNNRATSFTHVQGQGHILVIEDWENRDEPESAELVRLSLIHI